MAADRRGGFPLTARGIGESETSGCSGRAVAAANMLFSCLRHLIYLQDARMEHRQALQDRVARELRAHTEDDVLAESYRLKSRFPHIYSFPSRKRFFALIDSYLQDLAGKTVLDYGCGRGEASLSYLERGATVHGIDISLVYIESARQTAAEAGYTKDRCAFHVMDAHALEFEDGIFDLVVGYGILHHLDAELALAEIHRVLKPNGRVLLQEPLADNPLLKLYRFLTPRARTEDEAPFSRRDLATLAHQKLWKTELAYCGLLEAPVAMMTSVILPGHPDNVLLRWADRLERWTHRREVLLSWNQYVLFNMVKAEATV